jgi:hypothetical protein
MLAVSDTGIGINADTVAHILSRSTPRRRAAASPDSVFPRFTASRQAEEIALKFSGEIDLLLTDVVKPGTSGARVGLPNHSQTPEYAGSVHVGLYGKRGDEWRLARKKPGLSAETLLARFPFTQNPRSPQPDDEKAPDSN